VTVCPSFAEEPLHSIKLPVQVLLYKI